MSDWEGDPIVIDPPGFDQAKAWKWHMDEVDKCGGLQCPDGETNWKAASSADPGICSCPACKAMYWAFGRYQRCRKCGFEYPTNWWSMYSAGSQAASRGDTREGHKGGWALYRERQYEHKYFRHAYENKLPGGMEQAQSIDWKAVFPDDATQCKPEETTR